MDKNKWTEASAIEAVRRAGLEIDSAKVIFFDPKTQRPGLHPLGAMDYLTNHCKYIRTLPIK